MTTHFLKYWLYSTVDYQLDDPDPLLGHSASDQYSRVRVGDEIWVVTQPPKSGRLILVGRMTVAWIGSQAEAAARLGTTPETLWESKYHVIAAPPADPIELIDITSAAGDLRFQSPSGIDRLDLQDGRIDPKSLQSMRVLAPETVNLLRDIWYGTTESPAFDLDNSFVNSVQAYSEGAFKLYSHFRRERNPKLVAAAKQHFKAEYGRLYCEVCGFDFAQHYGDLGDDFIEAHHRKPFADLTEEETSTTVHDLAMVCPNCHRMLHRRKPWLTVEELRAQLHARNSGNKAHNQ